MVFVILVQFIVGTACVSAECHPTIGANATHEVGHVNDLLLPRRKPLLNFICTCFQHRCTLVVLVIPGVELDEVKRLGRLRLENTSHAYMLTRDHEEDAWTNPMLKFMVTLVFKIIGPPGLYKDYVQPEGPNDFENVVAVYLIIGFVHTSSSWPG